MRHQNQTCKLYIQALNINDCLCFDQDVSLSRIVAGLDLHRELLQDIRKLLSSTEELSLLIADIRDLSAQVHQVLPSDPLTSLTEVLPATIEV